MASGLRSSSWGRWFTRVIAISDGFRLLAIAPLAQHLSCDAIQAQRRLLASQDDRAAADLPGTGGPSPLAPTICSISLRSGQLRGCVEVPTSAR